MKKYNLSSIMKRAWELVKKAAMTISAALKKAWKEAKEMKEEVKMKVIEKYDDFNFRRYSNPWVAIVGEDGKLDFSRKVGGYTGAYGNGEAGELFVTHPIEGAVYAYGQKDYRHRSGYEYVQYSNGEFVPVKKAELTAALGGKIGQ